VPGLEGFVVAIDDSRRLIAVGTGSAVYLLDSKSLESVDRIDLPPVKAPIVAITFKNGPKEILLARGPFQIVEWSLKGKRETASFKIGGKGLPVTLGWERTRRRLMVGYESGYIDCVDMSSGTLDWSTKVSSTLLFSVSMLESASQIAVAAGGGKSTELDGTAAVFDIKSGELIASCVGHSGYVLSATLYSNGKRMVSSGEDGTVRLWDCLTRKELGCFSSLEMPPTPNPVEPWRQLPDGGRSEGVTER
jgi:WD40 repeat protein